VIVALALAEQRPADIAGLVLLSSYYFWTLRPDVLPVTIRALPIIGDILRYTVSPLPGWLMMPLFKCMPIISCPSKSRKPSRRSAQPHLMPPSRLGATLLSVCS